MLVIGREGQGQDWCLVCIILLVSSGGGGGWVFPGPLGKHDSSLDSIDGKAMETLVVTTRCHKTCSIVRTGNAINGIKCSGVRDNLSLVIQTLNGIAIHYPKDPMQSTLLLLP